MFLDKGVGLACVMYLILLPVCTVAGECDRTVPQFTPYNEILRRSNVVLIGKVQRVSIVEAHPSTKGSGKAVSKGGLSFPTPAGFRRKDLSWSAKLFASRAVIQVVCPVKGGTRKGDLLNLNVAFGNSEEDLKAFMKSSPAKEMTAPDTMLVLHLKQSLASAEKKQPYELVVIPWKLDKKELESKTKEMMTRIARYAAFLRVDFMVGNFDSLTEDDLAELKRLAAGKGPNMGTVDYLPIEQKILDAALSSKGKSKDAAAAWLAWWKWERLMFIDKPFRIIAGRPKPEPKTGKE